MNHKILLVEDDAEISELLKNYLTTENYDVVCAQDGEAACAAFDSDTFSLVLLDLMIPKISGMEVMQHIRAHSFVPILIVSAKDSEADKALGLGLGADDYITKPFSVVEVLARIKANIRRSEQYGRPAALAAPEALTAIDLGAVSFWGSAIVSAFLSLCASCFALAVGMKMKSSKACVISAFVVMLVILGITQGNVIPYFSASGAVAYLVQIVGAILAVFVSIHNVETEWDSSSASSPPENRTSSPYRSPAISLGALPSAPPTKPSPFRALRPPMPSPFPTTTAAFPLHFNKEKG